MLEEKVYYVLARKEADKPYGFAIDMKDLPHTPIAIPKQLIPVDRYAMTESDASEWQRKLEDNGYQTVLAKFDGNSNIDLFTILMHEQMKKEKG